MLNPFSHRRFQPLDIAIAILFAGWVPSILMAVVSYSILTKTLESKIVIDRRTVVQTLSHLIGYDLVRTAEVVEYYQNLPMAKRMVLRPYGDSAAQEWLAEALFSHPRIDGFFLTDASGRLISSVPLDPKRAGQPYANLDMLDGAKSGKDAYVSAVVPRPVDHRLATFILTPISSKSGEILGFIGATELVERIGRRLAAFDFGEQSVAQVVDQDGFPLFDANLEANKQLGMVGEPSLLKELRSKAEGHFQFDERLFSSNRVEGTQWIASLAQPIEVAYRPIHDLVSKTAILAAWLVVGTSVAAWLVSRLYRNQLAADERIARETLLNEKILANMPVGIAIIDPETLLIVQHNESWLKMMREFGGLAGGQDAGNIRVHDLNLGVEEMCAQVTASGVPFHIQEREALSPAGEARFFTLNLIRLQDLRSKVQGILFLVQDKTPDVSMRQELIAANTSKDQFLALLSHELRNPLSPVIMMVAELEQRADGSPEVHNAIEVIRRNVELEAHLIDDLLDVTRITHNKLELQPAVIDAHETIKRALEICQNDINEKGLRVVLDLEAEHFYVNADPARLQQVFWNVIKNGVKFTSVGAITVRTKNSGKHLVVDVSDTGIGIDPEAIGRIFKAFEQVERSITRTFGGLGLGLAISKAMVDAHGGTLTAASEGKGKGATFTVQLTTVDAPAEKTSTSIVVQTSTHTDGSRRILVVDDHLDTCMGMKMLLERRGYEVTVAHNVADALERNRESSFDLLISDLGLPDGTGCDLMERIQKVSPLKGIALSGFGTEEDVSKSKAAGFSDHLIKPINMGTLDAILTRLFG